MFNPKVAGYLVYVKSVKFKAFFVKFIYVICHFKSLLVAQKYKITMNYQTTQ